MNRITHCFAVPDSESIIDVVNPDTGRSHIRNETLEQVRERYPGAELVSLAGHVECKAARQDAEPKEWRECTEERYHDMLGALPPAAMVNGAFLVGEPYDHHAKTGQPRFTAFKHSGGIYYELSSHITHKQFVAMCGECSCDYVS